MVTMFIGGLFGALEAEVGDVDRSETQVLSGQRYWPFTGVVFGRLSDVDVIYTWEGMAAEYEPVIVRA